MSGERTEGKDKSEDLGGEKAEGKARVTRTEATKRGREEKLVDMLGRRVRKE